MWPFSCHGHHIRLRNRTRPHNNPMRVPFLRRERSYILSLLCHNYLVSNNKLEGMC